MKSNLVLGNWNSPTESCALTGDYCLCSWFLQDGGDCTGESTA
jgi:hypothetical protein